MESSWCLAHILFIPWASHPTKTSCPTWAALQKLKRMVVESTFWSLGFQAEQVRIVGWVSFEVSCYNLLILRPLNSQRMVLEGGSDLLQLRFSDTTNLYISRLIHAGHRVTLACRHFHVVDKIGSTHGDFFQFAIESCWSLWASSIDESERM